MPGASVTLEFTADLSAAEQRYEAFVRKVSQPIALNFAGQAGAGGPATFGNTAGQASQGFSLPYQAAPSSSYNEAFQRRADSEKVVAAANARLAYAINQQAAALSVGAAGGGLLGGNQSNSVINNLISNVGAGGGGTGATAGGGGGTGGRSRFLGLSTSGLARYVAAGFLLRETSSILRAAQEAGIEERLAVNEGGGTDLQRQYKAQIGFANKISEIPIVGGILDFAVEAATGYREDAQRKIDYASRVDDRLKAGREFGVYSRDLLRSGRILAAPGQYEEAKVKADVDRQREEEAARERRDAIVRANQSLGNFNTGRPDATLKGDIDTIKKSYDRTIEKIGVSYASIVRQTEGEINALVLEKSGSARAGARQRFVSEAKATYETERDPALYDIRKRRAIAAVEAYDAKITREDTADIADLRNAGGVSNAQFLGSSAGTLAARQAERRSKSLGHLADDDPRRSAIEGALQLQERSENSQFSRQNFDSYMARLAERDVSAIAASGPYGSPNAARVESIYRRAELSATQLARDPSTVDQARLELETGRNELDAYRKQLLAGGSGIEVAPGAYARGGTQGSETDDAAQTLKSIDTKMQLLNTAIDRLNSIFNTD